MGTDAALAALGLSESAQSIEITRAFRALSRQTHPDVGGTNNDFATVVAAYRTLQSNRSSQQQARRTPTPAENHYRRFLRQIEGLRTTSIRSAAPQPRTGQPMVTPSVTFAEILERELLRAG